MNARISGSILSELGALVDMSAGVHLARGPVLQGPASCELRAALEKIVGALERMANFGSRHAMLTGNA